VLVVTKVVYSQWIRPRWRTRCSAIAERPRCRVHYSFG